MGRSNLRAAAGEKFIYTERSEHKKKRSQAPTNRSKTTWERIYKCEIYKIKFYLFK